MVDACKLCGSQAALVPRSHVIPQWMYALLPHDGRPMKIVSSHRGEFEQRSQTGPYGQFVCQPCEDRFTHWDTYASDVLRRAPTLTISGWNYGSYVYGDLARFFLSILWRASACGHRFFETVDIKDRQAPLSAALLSDDDASLDAFEVWPSRSGHLLACGVAEAPKEASIESVPYWRLYMPQFQALIKVTSQSGAPCVQPHKLKPNSPLLLLEKNFTEFGEVDTAEQVFRTNMEKKNARRR